MSRNENVLFSSLPSIDMQRSIFNMPQKIITTFNVGELVPFFLMECLPSDSIRINTSKVFRLQTLLTPIFDSLVADVYYFFVPNRLVWSHWKNFMGENTNSAYLDEVEYTPPKINVNGSKGLIASGDVLDYMGVPVWSSSNHFYNKLVAFPYRGYQLIWNEFFRDQNLQDPVNINTGDSDIDWKDVDADDKKCLPVNKLHDYFTSALIAPAKTADGFVAAYSNRRHGPAGAATTNPPFGIPIVTGDTRTETNSTISLHGYALNSGGDKINSTYLQLSEARNSADDGKVNVIGRGSVESGVTGRFIPDNLWADTYNFGFGITIPALRTAFQMQKFLERDASHGTRYQETILAHFRCRAEDSRLQRPEYLGGNRIPLNIQQITNNAQSSGQYLGDLGAMSLTTDNHYDVEWSCCEHGFIIGVCCVRQQGHYYPQGVEHFWSRNTRFDYFWPEFSRLTDQPIRNWEIYAAQSSDADDNYGNEIFGYQERYAEYKMRLDKVTGEMRPGITNSLASWNLADHYTDKVYLSDEWIREDKSNVDRTLAVTSAVSNQILADFYVDCKATRPMPVHSVPGLADHF